MSKHSIRTGSASSSSASCRPSSASTRCWRRRSARSFSWSSASRALRSASSRMRRLSPRSAARISTGPPRRSASTSASTSSVGPSASSRWTTISARDRQRARVVLERRTPRRPRRRSRLGLVLEVEATGGRRARRRGPGRPARWRRCRRPRRRSRRRADRLVATRWRSSSERTACRRLRSSAACSKSCSPAASLHALLELALDLAEAAGEEAIDAVDDLAVLLLGDVADARRLAALDVVVEARAAGRAPRLRSLAGAVQEDLAEQVERLAHALRVRVRAEVGAVAAVALAREVDAREVLVERDRDVRVRLVVAQPDVEARPVLLDEVLLGEQRLGLGARHDELDALDLVRASPSPRGPSGWRSGDATRLRIDFALPTYSTRRARPGTGTRRAGRAVRRCSASFVIPATDPTNGLLPQL